MYLEERRVTCRHLKYRIRTNEPFMSIDDYVFPFLPNRRANIRSIGRCDLHVGAKLADVSFDL